MLTEVVWRKRLLLKPADVPASLERWEVVGAFNPGAAVLDGRVVLLVRVAERPAQRRPGYVGLPRWEPAIASRGVWRPVVDWVAEEELEPVDPRVVRWKQDGTVRLTFTSHLRVVHCGQGTAVERLGAAWTPAEPYEAYGIEDPRITWLDGRYWITYVAVSEHGAATALASTSDFETFQRHGVIFPPENKDVALFPERIGDKYFALHRPNGATPFTAPEMWVAASEDLVHWGEHRPLSSAATERAASETAAGWRTGRVGGGCPPVRVGDRWLEIYHGNQRPRGAGEVGRYVGAAMWLDAQQPWRIVRSEPRPWLQPSEPYERQGLVSEVVFPTGLVQHGGRVLVYYGAADSATAVAEAPAETLFEAARRVRAASPGER